MTAAFNGYAQALRFEQSRGCHNRELCAGGIAVSKGLVERMRAEGSTHGEVLKQSWGGIHR